MARVSKETKLKIDEFVNKVSLEKLSGCGTCTETLTHYTKQGEAETGGPTATITKCMAERINQDASQLDRVSGEQLRGRVRDKSGDLKRYNVPNKPNSEYNWQIWHNQENKMDKPYSLELCRSFCNDGQVFPAMQYKIDKEGKPKKQAGREVEDETDGAVTAGRAIQVYRRRVGGTDA